MAARKSDDTSKATAEKARAATDPDDVRAKELMSSSKSSSTDPPGMIWMLLVIVGVLDGTSLGMSLSKVSASPSSPKTIDGAGVGDFEVGDGVAGTGAGVSTTGADDG